MGAGHYFMALLAGLLGVRALPRDRHVTHYSACHCPFPGSPTGARRVQGYKLPEPQIVAGELADRRAAHEFHVALDLRA